jgi:ubiquitin-conjugating enzyme E2 S
MADRSDMGSSCCAPPPAVLAGVMKELKNMKKSPPDGIKVFVNESNIADVQADIEGPAGTPFENGKFKLKLVLGSDYPQIPPKGYFITNIFHPNVSKGGDICVNTLKQDWNPSHGIRHILMVIRCLLIEPFPESALNDEASKLLLEDYEEYARRAKLMTSIHAASKKKTKVPLSTDVANQMPTEKKQLAGMKSPLKDKRNKKKSLKRL